ncbi:MULTISPECIES: peptidoglycan-binding protein [unclassified Streptomyces]|uniref:peptidoglycan-binding protein n=1 Tax=unclassified Streptomyces TaxID=2593676 RepID=UPI0006AFA605|nr:MULTISPECIES: peptidoglycan-binding protein [unclassified Streptomyces]KOX35708.1 membrane protein [Streptomyces sp. NRRL F-6491]KOX50985.1 membrane protein [Streptomyces sp. NRRL F-6492]
MSVPVFEEIEPAADCPCPGCARQRRDLALGLPVRAGGHPAARGARRALVLMTAAGVVLGGGSDAATALARAADAPADEPGNAAGDAPADAPGDAPDPDPAPAVGPDTPQGGRGPLHGAPGPGPGPGSGPAPAAGQPAAEVPRPTTRAEIIDRAELWVAARVPYSMEKYWTDGYRQDCSGYVSMAWNLRGNEWTGSLDRFGDRIDRADLQPGDILLFHNPADPTRGSHVTIFGGWADSAHTSYTAYEQTRPRTRKKTTPLAYWENSDRYVAYRHKGVVSGGAGGGQASAVPPFPGAAKFGPGRSNAHVTRLGRLLVARGGKKFYAVGPGPRWTGADRRATRAFQQAQGWRGREADGLPGPHTWKLLVTGKGRSIGGSSGSGGSSANAAPFPGRGSFRPGRSNAYVEKLGKQLVKRGFGKHYLSGPGPRWTEADRRNVEAFQRAQGWRGGAADGYPGPETWRRLFR